MAEEEEQIEETEEGVEEPMMIDAGFVFMKVETDDGPAMISIPQWINGLYQELGAFHKRISDLEEKAAGEDKRIITV